MRRIAANYYVRHFCIVSPAEGSVTAARRRCYGGASVGAGGPAGGLGPLETGDLIGLDTILFSLEVLYESYNDGKFRPCPLLRKMIDAGLQGRKTGRGFYTYEMAQ